MNVKIVNLRLQTYLTEANMLNPLHKPYDYTFLYVPIEFIAQP